MRAWTRRLDALESTSRAIGTNLDHLSDEELDQYAFDLIARFGEAGVPLPNLGFVG